MSLDTFATAEEAALAVARADRKAGGPERRAKEAQQAAAAPASLTPAEARRQEAQQRADTATAAAEARRQAETEGLTLVTSRKSSTWKAPKARRRKRQNSMRRLRSRLTTRRSL